MEVPGGSQQRGQDCSLRVHSACSPRLCTLRVPLARGSCSSQRPLTARAPVAPPLPAPRCIWPQLSSSPGASPLAVFLCPSGLPVFHLFNLYCLGLVLRP